MSVLSDALIQVQKTLAGPKPPDLFWARILMRHFYIESDGKGGSRPARLILFVKRNDQNYYFTVTWMLADRDWLERPILPPGWNEGWPKKMTTLADGLCQK